jgi:hypothetical protein
MGEGIEGNKDLGAKEGKGKAVKSFGTIIMRSTDGSLTKRSGQ